MGLSAATIMLGPILAPIALSYGLDPIHFGFVVVMNLTIGLLTPPVGVCLFVVSGIARISMERLVRAVWPFLLWQIVVLFLVTYIPAVAMVIPWLFGYRTDPHLFAPLGIRCVGLSRCVLSWEPCQA